jgi:hypothetical protein
MRYSFYFTMVMAVSCAGCASVFDGTSQEIKVVTNPAGAACVFEREGFPIASVSPTPGTALIQKTKYDVTVKCDKTGYEQAIYLNHSGVSAAIAGNIAADLILTAGLSSIVDSATGADNKYDSVVNLTLAAKAPMPAAYIPVPVSPR